MRYKVFITKANLNKTISDYNIMSYPVDVDDDEYWDSTIRFFNRLDKKKILVWKDVLKKGNFQDVFKKLKRRDTRQYVNPETFPDYHYDKDCRFLYNDFMGYRIPDHITTIDKIFEEIFDKGFNKIKKEDAQYLEKYYKNYTEFKKQGYFDKMHKHNNQYQKYNGSEFDYVEKFRNWFKKNEYLLESNSNVLFERARMRFGDIGSKSQLIVEYANSGLATTTKKINDVKEKIDKLLEQSEKFINESEENYEILSNYGQITHLYNNKEEVKKIALEMKISEEKIIKILKTFHLDFKLEVIKSLREYWILKLNPELSFSSHELDNVRFKKCKVCWSSTYIDDETLNDLEKDFGKSSTYIDDETLNDLEKDFGKKNITEKINRKKKEINDDSLKTIRLNKVLREFNISLVRLIKFLSSQGHDIEARPTTKISQVQYDLISNKFSKQ